MKLRCLFVFVCCCLAPMMMRAQGDAVRVEVASDREYYLEDAQTIVCLDLRLLGEPLADNSAPQNVVLVMDRSGSMAGDALQAIRDAITDVARSHRPDDSIAVIFFGSDVDPALDLSADPGALAGQLSQLEAVGGSATYDALNQAAAQLRRRARPTVRNHLVLLTDGPATKGPREKVDFLRLVDAFAREGISISTIGLGPDFDEDLLAALARQGKGQFQYIDSPSKIRDALANELSSARRVVARNVDVKLEFGTDAGRIEPYGSVPHALANHAVTWTLPVVYAGEKRSLIVSAHVRTRRFEYPVGTLEVKWTDPDTGRVTSRSRKIAVKLERDEETVRHSGNVEVLRNVSVALATEGMQEAIQRIDKGDFKGALRRLKRARTDVDFLNYGFDDPEIEKRVAQLDAYLNEVKARGFNQLDRKVLRSGLVNQFDVPSEAEESKP